MTIATFILMLCMFAVLLASAFAFSNFLKIKRLGEGDNLMREIAAAIREGANAFLELEYKALIAFSLCFCLAIGILITPSAGIACVIGVIMSSLPSWIGMSIATYANVRTTNTAKISRKISKTVSVALRAGSVMGLSVAASALMGFIIVWFLFGEQLLILDTVTNWIGLNFSPFTMTLSSYSLGCSTVAIFARIGGGIYTKAADMGADLVGKMEYNIPEDDPRNAATIADNVGDCVGDVAGLGSDLLESNVGAIVSAMMLGIYTFTMAFAPSASMEYLNTLCMYPLGVAALGLISCVIGLFVVLSRELSNNPHKDLNKATFISAGLTAISTAALAFFMFRGMDCSVFRFGAPSPWIAAVMGVISGIAVGKISEYYTSDEYKPTRRVSAISKSGAALTIVEGLAVGMESALPAGIVLVAALLLAFASSGLYGIALAGAGMLSFVATTVSVDTYGPISDNAGGIAEMAHLDHGVREITDELDAVGNTTAAIGKGFAIGSATFAALGLMVNYLNAFRTPGEGLSLNIMNPLVLGGIIAGGMLPGFFSGMLMRSVMKAANAMVNEVRQQFEECPAILEGTVRPNYKRCIEISSKTSLKEMRASAVLAVVVPIVSGFLLGPEFVAGVLMGSILISIFLAIFCGNAGGTWDNAKKYIEKGLLDGEGKGSVAHIASIVGDTVGDPLKDTVGPCLDIFIKIESTVALVTVPLFTAFNFVNLLTNIL